MTDIVERLRDRYNKWGSTYRVSPPCELDEAADEIERLRELAATIDGWLIVTNRELGELKQQLETERMRLAACGVVALANTPGSAIEAREMQPEYWSESCAEVARAVDREMEHRDRVKALEQQLASQMVPDGWKMVPAAERVAFEKWAEAFYFISPLAAPRIFQRRDDDGYGYEWTHHQWVAWQARAQLGAVPVESSLREAATGGRGEYVRGVQAMATEAKQLCRDFSDLRDRPYMGDVTVAIDALAEQVAAAQPAKEQKL